MKVSDVMTREVVSIAPEAAVMEAVRLMLQHKVSGLPVIDAAGRLQGVVTEGDFLRRVETGTERKRSRFVEFLLGPGRLAEDYVHASGRKVDEVMTPEPRTVGEDEPLEKVVHLMERYRVKRLPVMRGKKVVGMVTRSNLMRAMVSLSRAEPKTGKDDASIREMLLAEMQKESWAPAAMANVVVCDGVVELWGVIIDERQREALKIAAENIPGVRAVKDHLVWVEPVSGMVIAPRGGAAA